MRVLKFLAFSCRFVFCLAMLLGVLQVVSFAQKPIVWQKKTDLEIQTQGRRFIAPQKYLVYGLDRINIKNILDQAPLEFSSEASRGKPLILEIPSPDGKTQHFRIEESPLLSPEIAVQFPEWKTYQGYGVEDPTATARFDFTQSGFHAYVLSDNGTYSIDPFQEGDRGNYIVYYKKDFQTDKSFHCDFDENEDSSNFSIEPNDEVSSFSAGTQIRTYRLAVAATGEYTNFFRQAGDTDDQAKTRALNAIIVTVNRVTGIYRKDLALSFTLVSGVNLIYTDSATDPYANTSGDLNANQTNIDSVIGSANYDLGHLVGTGGGGVAGLRVSCSTNKARGLTGSSAPVGDPFDIDYVAHEMGHQVGGNHTFNSTNSNCGGGNRSSVAAYEPGSAATIMGYAGICGAADLQKNSIDNFHIVSQTEIVAHTTGSGVGATCGTVAGTNSIPTIASLTSYSIPFNTPFILTANATDSDGDPLTYSWEEYDLGAASNYPATPDDDDTTLAIRPLFRSYSPKTNTSRTFPSLPYILNNSNEAPINFTGTAPTGIVCSSGTCVTGEDLPSIARTMNFRVSVRDGKGGIADAGMTVTSVNTSTPFKVTAGNTPTSFLAGANRTITWDVSGTNNAPINVANVKISLSTDGGLTFPIVLAASTPNDGSESVAIPNTLTTTARIKIEAIGNIFFDINDVNITISNTASPAAIAAGTLAITSESCGVANNQPDPGETLTVTLPLSNNGGTSTNNLTATLQATGGVSSAATQTYGALAPGSSAVTRSFTFTVNPNLACGTPVTLTFVVSDGSTTYSNITQTYQTGVATVSMSQNFDSVTAPTLPTGWTSVQTSGSAINWITTTTTPNSAPNAAFAASATVVSAAALISPPVTVSSASAQIKFKNKFELEDSATTAGAGFDGMVLEYSTNGTNWTDIVTGGGSFVSGGYTDTISSSYGSPISGRMAWSGSSGGYIDTVVNLPASLNGQSVQFRWIVASDNSESVTGAWVDDVQVLGGVTCQSCSVTPGVCRIQRRNDFNGDGTTDYSVYRPSSGTWFVLSSGSNAVSGYNFGASTDKLQPGDYDGDGKTDYAVFRNGTWYWTQSSDNTVKGFGFGANTDIPVAGDYTGDGKTDLAVYRPSNGVWYVLNSATGGFTGVQWGGDATDVPVVGDFDGDCKMDYAVRRTTASTNASIYYILKSSGGASSINWGRSDMAMAVGDYNGDGKSDIGAVETRNGLFYWYTISGDGATVLVNGIQFGQTGDIVTVGDYNGDSNADLSVWRSSTGVFYYRGVGNATQFGQAFGASTDTPTARWYQYPLP